MDRLEKFKAMVHYIVASSDDDPHRLGATKLNKICWFADTLAFRLSGSPITNARYVKRAKGPVPKDVLLTLKQLEDEGKIKVRHSDHQIYKTRLFINLEDADTGLFSPVELSILDSVIKTICDHHTASSISDLTHDRIWEAANEGEELPLWVSLAGRAGQITDEVTKWADSVIQATREMSVQSA
jgi:Protein of unknown function (DUF4065)